MSTIGAGPVLAAATAPAVGTSSLALHAKAITDVPTLPAGFPAHLSHELAWAGSDFSKTSKHILVLNDVDHAEIKAALDSYKCTCFPPQPALPGFVWLTRPGSARSRWRPRGAFQLPAADSGPEARGAQP
jgi:hypothetical protein